MSGDENKIDPAQLEYVEFEDSQFEKNPLDDIGVLEQAPYEPRNIPALLLVEASISSSEKALQDFINKVNAVFESALRLEAKTKGVYLGVDLTIAFRSYESPFDESVFPLARELKDYLTDFLRDSREENYFRVYMLPPTVSGKRLPTTKVFSAWLNGLFRSDYYQDPLVLLMTAEVPMKTNEISNTVKRYYTEMERISTRPLAPSPVFMPFDSTEQFYKEERKTSDNAREPQISYGIYGVWDKNLIEATGLWDKWFDQDDTQVEEPAEFLKQQVKSNTLSVIKS